MKAATILGLFGEVPEDFAEILEGARNEKARRAMMAARLSVRMTSHIHPPQLPGLRLEALDEPAFTPEVGGTVHAPRSDDLNRFCVTACLELTHLDYTIIAVPSDNTIGSYWTAVGTKRDRLKV